ncbi:MAG TPA: hypothetical protein VGG74_32980 [Kofleriaceae bacterium]|jgi:hypothetical protein
MPRIINTTLLALLAVACGDNNKGTPIDAASNSDAPAGQHDAARQLDAFEFRDAPADPTGISTALGMPDGPTNVAINNVTVTYLKPQISSPDDPVGFTIQANQQGPGLFVTVDPSMTTPALAVGDVISFTITDMTSLDLERRADAISNITRSAQGSDVSTLSRDVSSATDLVNNIAAYDSTLVTVTGTFATAFSSSGTGMQATQLNTAGISGNAALTFRVPASLVDQLDMAATCNVVATNIPFDRFKSTAELGAYGSADFTMSTCPAPMIASAVATSATTIDIAFTRHIDPATFDGSGDQFTFDQGLTVASAVLTDRTVTLTTSPQVAGTTYTLTFAGTPLKDTMGTAFTPPTPSPMIPGFTVQAGVVINELNASVAKSCDLIELRVTSDGTMGGFKLTERLGTVSAGELNYTFPQGFNVTKNSIVVFHENSGSGACNPNGATQELLTPTDQPGSNFAGNYDTAYDFWGSDAGLTGTDNVITLYDGTGAIIDTVFLDGSGSGAADTVAAANLVGSAQWATGTPPYTGATFVAAAVPGLGSASLSIQRNSDTDTNTVADWTSATPTYGTLNANQQTLPVLRHRHR